MKKNATKGLIRESFQSQKLPRHGSARNSRVSETFHVQIIASNRIPVDEDRK